MRFAYNTGGALQATTKTDAAHELYKRSYSRIYARDVHDWCARCAARITQQHGCVLEYTTLEGFVDELIRYGLIVEIN